ncbi:MAG: hypothetical protein RL748_2257 [Pseudomonadota bacterium]|jgi:hypothetical protein
MMLIDGIAAEFLLSACLRYDMSPIPLTLEATVRLTPATAGLLRDGQTIVCNGITFRIVKAEPTRNPGSTLQGDYPLSAIQITAFPDSVAGVAARRRSAVIVSHSGFAALYRACGATAKVIGDIPIRQFAVYCGALPTPHLAQVLQEAGAIMVWRSGQIHLLRLRELLNQPIQGALEVASSETLQSSLLELDDIPVYFSTQEQGGFIQGPRHHLAQCVRYAPGKNQAELALMGKVLVQRTAITTELNCTLRAGDVIALQGLPLVIMTAAHVMQNNVDGAGLRQYSRFWLGSGS